jgi:hypothetical protein
MILISLLVSPLKQLVFGVGEGSPEVWTQGQIFYHLSHASSPFCSGYFGLTLCPGQLGLRCSCRVPTIAGDDRHILSHSAIGWDEVSPFWGKFCPGYLRTVIFLIVISLEARTTGMRHLCQPTINNFMSNSVIHLCHICINGSYQVYKVRGNGACLME